MRSNHNFHRFKWLAVKDGFLDKVFTDFAAGLNCIIGARGSGKTTVLEVIRYVLDAMPEDPAARKRLMALVESNLGGGRAELAIETKEGLSYIISRSAGEAPLIQTHDRRPTDLGLKVGDLIAVDLYSQNEVENIADFPLEQLELVDKFAASEVADATAQIARVQSALTANANAIEPLEGDITGVSMLLEGLPGVEEKLRGLATASGSDARPVQEAHHHRAMRDRERRALDTVSRAMAEQHRACTGLMGVFEKQLNAQFPPELLGSANKAILRDLCQELHDCGAQVEVHLKQILTTITTGQQRLAVYSQQLAAAHTREEAAFHRLLEKHEADQGLVRQRMQLERQRNDLMTNKSELDDLTARLRTLREERKELLMRLSSLRDERYKIRMQVVDRLNKSLSPVIQVSLLQAHHKEKYIQLLEHALQDARIRQRLVAQKLATNMMPAALIQAVRTQDVDLLVAKADLNEEQAEKVVQALNTSGRLFELEQVEQSDLPKIELKVGETYKESPNLSIGQKCTTILPILLLESERPLLVDQPEDNLDNGFISQTVVSSLNRIKDQRQVIFVTHNPNIPVLGNADKVVVLQSDGTKATVVKSGSVDECKSEIVSLLEGGEAAFKQRKVRYAY